MNKTELRAKAKSRSDTFVNDFAEKYGSACEVWMGEADRERLRRAYASGEYEFAQSSTEASARRRLANGWKLLADERNFDNYDAVFYKKKSSRRH